MEAEIPPAAPTPSPDPSSPGAPRQEPQPAGAPPPIEVRAEPAGPQERARVYDAPPVNTTSRPSAPPPPAPEPAWRKQGWPIACHAVGLIDFGFTAVPGLIASLVVWLIKKDEDPEVDFHGKEAINFQITLMVAWAVGALLTFCLIGIPILVVLPFVKIVLMIVASVKAANGERWRYPWTFRVLR